MKKIMTTVAITAMLATSVLAEENTSEHDPKSAEEAAAPVPAINDKLDILLSDLNLDVVPEGWNFLNDAELASNYTAGEINGAQQVTIDKAGNVYLNGNIMQNLHLSWNDGYATAHIDIADTFGVTVGADERLEDKIIAKVEGDQWAEINSDLLENTSFTESFYKVKGMSKFNFAWYCRGWKTCSDGIYQIDGKDYYYIVKDKLYYGKNKEVTSKFNWKNAGALNPGMATAEEAIEATPVEPSTTLTPDGNDTVVANTITDMRSLMEAIELIQSQNVQALMDAGWKSLLEEGDYVKWSVAKNGLESGWAKFGDFWTADLSDVDGKIAKIETGFASATFVKVDGKWRSAGGLGANENFSVVGAGVWSLGSINGWDIPDAGAIAQVEEAYNEGYNVGYAEGYVDGFADGFEAGLKAVND